jgi:glyoxylase-like metal-dependent hydrolase (beta-lactamase superfamily II)
MKHPTRGPGRSLVAALAALLVGCGLPGQHRVTVHPTAAPRAFHDWAEVFAHPTALRVTAFVTGEVLVGPSILIEADDPRTPRALVHEQWVPALSYLVQHPTRGAMLLDTGVPRDTGSGCDFGVSPFFHIRCRAARGQDAASQLAELSVRPADLRYVMISHLHGDHAGGLRALLPHAEAPVLLSAREWHSADSALRVTRGYIGDLLGGTFAVETFDAAGAPSMPILGPVVDLLGDGSIWLVPTPGHTRGETAVLLNTEGAPILLTFDAAHLEANLERQIPPGFVVDRDEAVASLERLGRFHAAYPQVRVVYGHEPAQWSGRGTRVALAP